MKGTRLLQIAIILEEANEMLNTEICLITKQKT